MRGAIPPLLQYVFVAWCLVKHRDNFTLLTLPNTEEKVGKNYSSLLNHCQQMRFGAITSAQLHLFRILIYVHRIYSINNVNWLDNRGFEPQHGLGTTLSRLALGSTHPSLLSNGFQRLFPRVKRPECEANHSLPTST
jgi:hypothetical protein